MNIFAGNLSKDVTEEDLRKAFRAFGQVSFVNLARDRFKISLGFGILEMPIQVEAEAAIAALHATEMKGKPITVKERKITPQPAAENTSQDSSLTVEVTL